MKMTAQTRISERALPGTRPSAGHEAEYRRRMLRLIDDMGRSTDYWLSAQYRRTPPLTAMDETPAEALQREVKALGKQWTGRWTAAADKLAAWFATSIDKRSSRVMQRILREAGIAVEFRMTASMRDVIGAIVNENVGLIRSIPQQYLAQVEGIVMRGVQNGRDAHSVSEALQKQLGVTRRRAALIARDQNNKATASLARARQLEAGITEAIWMHSHAGNEPRPSHVKAGQEHARYSIAQGWYDPHEKRFIQPGELINCRCIGRPIVVGFSV